MEVTKQMKIYVAIGAFITIALFVLVIFLFATKLGGTRTALNYEVKQGEVNEEEAKRAIESIKIGGTIATESDDVTDKRMQQYWASKGISQPRVTESVRSSEGAKDLPTRPRGGAEGKAISDMRDQELLQKAAAELLPNALDTTLFEPTNEWELPNTNEVVEDPASFIGSYPYPQYPCTDPKGITNEMGVIIRYDCLKESR